MWFETNRDGIPFLATRKLCRDVSEVEVKYQEYLSGRLSWINSVQDADDNEVFLRKCSSITGKKTNKYDEELFRQWLLGKGVF